ncbi:sugar phosphate isomerase/epimerase [Nocardia anaemiae]|uniref:sugar phosphate isomerase/epimerase n=1 Tax=Nocardia anaemiae TaxID=263910 RepID=UPI0012F4C7F8|nr:sugar phosphate isomerase/epimerase [Nocardia anaemiae]
MEDLPWGAPRPWTLAEQLDQLVAAGFDGVAVDLGARGRPEAHELAALRRHRLRSAVFAFVGDDVDLDAALRYAEIIDADRMVVCGRVFDHDLTAVAHTVLRWHRRCAAAGVAMQLETHRNTLTDDIRTTTRLLHVLAADVNLAIDLSHYVCGSEFPLPPTAELEGQLDALFARAESVQGRIATRCQVQIPLGFPQHREWEALFQDCWVRAFTAILERRRRDGSLEPVLFCAELGTTPYAITDRNGRELSDRWAETLTLRDRAETAYAAAVHGTSITTSRGGIR